MKGINISIYREQLILKPVFSLLLFVIFFLCYNLKAYDKVFSENASQRDIKDAMRLLNEKIYKIYENVPFNLNPKGPYKISIYNELFAKGVKIKHACSSEELFTCQNDSYLFFVDEVPWAHYKHSVRIGIIDTKTKDIHIKQAEWWPVVNGKSYFLDLDDAQGKYITWPYNIDMIQPQISLGGYKSTCNCESTNLQENANYQNIIGGSFSKKNLWAIIILGAIVDGGGTNEQLAYDADGMYSILSAYGVPDNQIYYFKKKVKDASALINDCQIYSTCLDIHSITLAINEIQSKIKPGDKFLFFITTHGANLKLSLCKERDQCLNIGYCQMQKWLSKIRCKRLFVIINSCKSGSFVLGNDMSQCGHYDLSIPQGEFNDRVVITSCRYNENSAADIDNCDLNINDRGSEFIGGFLEAFTNAESDIDENKEISIGEAFDYARKYAACGGGSLTTRPFIPSYTPVIKCSFSRKQYIDPYSEFLFWD